MALVQQRNWQKKYQLWEQIGLKALPQHEILHKISENPEILEFEKFFDSPFLLDGEFDFLNKVNIADFIIKC